MYKYNGKEIQVAFNYGGLTYVYFVGYSNKDIFAVSPQLLEVLEAK